jgi:SAM-dependent methyltransferase
MSAHTFDFGGTRLAWDRCKDCTLVFQNPRLAESAISALYGGQDYFGRECSSNSAPYVDYVRYDPIRIKQGRIRMGRIIDVTGLHRGRLLDVGSASGFFGVAAREAGFDVTCIEPDADLASYGNREYGLTFLVNTLENCSLGCERYDVITVWGTNSVLLHPLRSFEQLVVALKPGGVLAMNTQDFDHWIRRIFPRLMIGWNVIFNLSNRSLEVLMEKLGLKLVHRGFEWQTVVADHVFRVLRVRAPAAFRQIVLKVPAVSFPLIIARK